MTVKELIDEYRIVEDYRYNKETGKNYTGNLSIGNVSKAKKDNVLSELKEKKQEILEYLKEERKEKEKERDERKKKIDSISGLKEIISAKEDLANWNAEFAKSFDDVGGLGVRPKPDYDFEAMYKKYPVAEAYLKAEEMMLKENDELSAIGKKAMDKIINNPEGYKEAIEEMEKGKSEFADKHIWD